MAPDADATAGASQGWHDLEAVLAKEPAATLLAAYLALPPRTHRKRRLPQWQQPECGARFGGPALPRSARPPRLANPSACDAWPAKGSAPSGRPPAPAAAG